MKTTYETTSVVKEKSVNYKSDHKRTDVCHIWIINSDGGVLIKKTHPSERALRTSSLTIQSDCSDNTFKLVESSTGILCSKDYLREAYEYESNERKVSGFIVSTNLDEAQKDIVENRFNGKFIDYQELMTKLSKRNLSDSSKESLLYLISVLYDKYNYL